MRQQRFRWVVFVGLLAAAIVLPFAYGTGGFTSLLEQIFAFGAFAMSYDLLIGCTGIISFGHAMFFGTGAYCVAICLNQGGGSTGSLLLGFLLAIIGSALISLVVAYLSLRMQDVYFAMITLAVGQAFYVLAGSEALRRLTNANDGITVSVPDWLSGDLQTYFLSVGFLFLTALILSRFVRARVGHALQGIRENEARMSALGHSVFRLKTTAIMVSGITAALAGGIYAIAQSFVSTTVYAVSNVSLEVLLMTLIGGIGTLYGGIVGAAVILVAQNQFSSLAGNYPIFNRYMIIFGVLYIVIVLFLPKGILGTIQNWRGRSTWKAQTPFKKSQI